MRVFLLHILLLTFLSGPAKAVTLTLSVDHIDKGNLVDLYGFPGGLELAVLVELIYLNSTAEQLFFSPQPQNLLSLQVQERGRVLARIPIPESLSVNQPQVKVPFDLPNHLLAPNNGMSPFLRLTLVEQSLGGICRKHNCEYNFTKLEVRSLQKLSRKLLIKAVKDKTGSVFSHLSNLEGQLTKKELRALKIVINEQFLTHNLLAVSDIVAESSKEGLKEPFWLSSAESAHFNYNVLGTVFQ